MSLTIRISPDLQESHHLPAVFEAVGPTVGDCLDNLTRRFPQTEEWFSGKEGLMQVILLLNQRTVLSPNALNLARVLGPTDELSIISLFAGG